MKNSTLMAYIALMTLTSLVQCQSTPDSFPVLKGPYLGQLPPSDIPQVFVPELFNVYGKLHGKLVFSPDGSELIWVITTTEKGEPYFRSLYMKQDGKGTWTPPVDSFLSKERKENGPSFSIDGNRIYYQSRSSLDGEGGVKDLDVWYREKTGVGWGRPVNIGEPVNSGADDSQPWIASDGSIYLCRDNKNVVAGQSGGSDIYLAEFSGGRYSEPVSLGAEVNSEYGDTEPSVAPDNSYIVFISNRPGGFSRMMNLYVSFKNPEGGWSEAICLSHELKIENIWFPTLSYDGKYLFFCGGYPVPGEGYIASNYYWVPTGFIDRFNPYR